MTLYRVSGCGITAVCQKGDSMLWLIQMIIFKGGIPSIEKWSEAA